MNIPKLGPVSFAHEDDDCNISSYYYFLHKRTKSK